MSSRQPSFLRQQSTRWHASTRFPAVCLHLLGGFELETPNQSLFVPLHVQRLLAFLALRGNTLRRAYVSGQLWGDATQEQAFASLRTTLWRTRAVPARLIDATRTHIALAPSVVVDALELAASVERSLQDAASLAASDVEQLAEADELLPDWYDDWVTEARDHLCQLRLMALEAASEQLAGVGRHRDAATAALAAVAADPLRESARRLLIRTCLQAGNRAEAARQLADFRARLERELGLEPSLSMVELERSLGPAPR